MESLIQSVLDIEGAAQVIVGITLNNEELKQFIENLPEEDAKIINIGERAFKLLWFLLVFKEKIICAWMEIEMFWHVWDISYVLG